MVAATRRSVVLLPLRSLLARSSPHRSQLEADLSSLIRSNNPHRVSGSSAYAAPSFSTSSSSSFGWGGGSLARKAISIVLLSVTGGVFLSAVNDLAIFHGCSSKAIEKAAQNPKVVEALGEPIVRGPWYDASLAVGRRRHTVSCTFPVSGPQGTAVFQLKAMRTGDLLPSYLSAKWCRREEIHILDVARTLLIQYYVPHLYWEDTWFSFLRHHGWDILVLEALLHLHSNDKKDRTFQISILDNDPLPTSTEKPQPPVHSSSEKPQPH